MHCNNVSWCAIKSTYLSGCGLSEYADRNQQRTSDDNRGRLVKCYSATRSRLHAARDVQFRTVRLRVVPLNPAVGRIWRIKETPALWMTPNFFCFATINVSIILIWLAGRY